MAEYASDFHLYLHECVNGNYSPKLRDVPFGELGSNIHFTGKVKDSEIVLRVSDGEKSVMKSLFTEHINLSGAVGLYYRQSNTQRFDKFIVADTSGETLFADWFYRPTGMSTEWRNAFDNDRWEKVWIFKFRCNTVAKMTPPIPNYSL